MDGQRIRRDVVVGLDTPFPTRSKNDVLMFRSIRSIVIAPASICSLNRRRRVIIATDKTNKGI